ncbi:MAG TPA: hypothetical protein VGI81_12945 [Tepidisphaeraceae bacterium]|jgi:tetratricopeptide (TPR) repeat protein
MVAESDWELVKQGRFEEAIQRIDEVYAKTQNESPLRNKVLALLLLERYGEAQSLSEWLVVQTNGRLERDFINSGIASWLSGAREQAVAHWQEAQRVKRYTDAAGGLMVPMLLSYGALRLNDATLARQARVRIAMCCRDSRAVNWPGPLGRFVLGDLDERELLALVTPQPILHERYMCSACFWIAAAMSNTDQIRSLELMRKAVTFAPPAYLEYEYYLAKGEVMRADDRPRGRHQTG